MAVACPTSVHGLVVRLYLEERILVVFFEVAPLHTRSYCCTHPSTTTTRVRTTVFLGLSSPSASLCSLSWVGTFSVPTHRSIGTFFGLSKWCSRCEERKKEGGGRGGGGGGFLGTKTLTTHTHGRAHTHAHTHLRTFYHPNTLSRWRSAKTPNMKAKFGVVILSSVLYFIGSWSCSRHCFS